MSTEPVTSLDGEPVISGDAAVGRQPGSLRALWAGGGAVGGASRIRRVRHRVRTLGSEHPVPYLAFARRKYPGPSPKVLDDRTRVVIDGYTRSASTFAVYAFQVAQRQPVPMAHHLHAAAQIRAAARRGLPTIVVIREPRGAVLSQVVREPGVDLLDALHAYRRFHRSLLPVRDHVVVADFSDVTADFGGVVRRLNARFATTYGCFGGTEAERALVNRLIEQRPTLSPVLLGFESGEVGLDEVLAEVERLEAAGHGDPTWVPSADRERAKAELAGWWSSPLVATARRRAEESYRAFLGSAR